MSSTALPLSDIVSVSVYVSPVPQQAPTFNIGAIVGSTPAISHATRMIVFTSAAAMLTAGFTTSSPEYIAAQIYFGQLVPPTQLYVGRQDLTSLATIIPHSGNAGINYVVGDVITVTQSGASGGQATVATVSSGGVVTSLTVVTLATGTGYAVATGLATTGGTGTGLEVDISAIGETPLVAIENCRALFSQPYGFMSTTAQDADHEAIALYAQANLMKYYAGTSTSTVPTSSTTDVASYCMNEDFDRIDITYSTTQGGLYPNNIYVAAASMGLEMGLNTGLAGSYFTKFGKTLVGIAPEPVNQSQYNFIKNKNCNVFTSFGPYSLLSPGKMSSGAYADFILFIDVLTANIQINVMNSLIELPAIPLTDGGEQLVIHAINNACQAGVEIGFISPGVWNGVSIHPSSLNPKLGIDPGDALTAGYESFAAPIAELSAANRAARALQPVFVCLIYTDSAQQVQVQVYAQA